MFLAISDTYKVLETDYFLFLSLKFIKEHSKLVALAVSVAVLIQIVIEPFKKVIGHPKRKLFVFSEIWFFLV